MYDKTIAYFEQLMQLLHPFMPFVTEEIYHLLADRKEGDDLVIRQFQSPGSINAGLLKEANLAKDVITAIRDARNKQQLKPKDTIKLFVETQDEQAYQRIESILAKQLNADGFGYAKEAIAGAAAIVVGTDKFYMLTEKEVDPVAQKEQLLKDLAYQQGFLVTVEKKLSNEKFVQNGKPEVVEAERKKLADCQARIQAIEESLKLL